MKFEVLSCFKSIFNMLIIENVTKQMNGHILNGRKIYVSRSYHTPLYINRYTLAPFMGYPGISQKIIFLGKFLKFRKKNFFQKNFFCIFGFLILFAVRKRYLSPLNSHKNLSKIDFKVDPKFLRGTSLDKKF